MTEPTDAEIIALNAGEIHFSESPTKYPEAGHGTQYHAGAPGVLSFARAVLAKWGTPPAVAGEKVYLVATGLTNEAGTVGLYERHENFVPLADCEVLYTTPQPTQAQAGAVPLPSVELMRIVMDVEQKHHFLRGTTNWAVAVGRAIEAAHGIKGGQHGADI